MTSARPMGEYVLELRENSISETWRPSVDADPVPDHNDMATEQAAARLRSEAAKLNREAGWYKYRTQYVVYTCDHRCMTGRCCGGCGCPGCGHTANDTH